MSSIEESGDNERSSAYPKEQEFSAMPELLGIKSYTSPRRKLVRFFEGSRDQWKAKCRDAKSTVKHLKNKVGFLKKSRARWKGRVRALEEELARLRAQEQVWRNEKEAFKKKPT